MLPPRALHVIMIVIMKPFGSYGPFPLHDHGGFAAPLPADVTNGTPAKFVKAFTKS
jgi:hypothetical protein